MNITVIGGGTGTYTVLKGIKDIPNVNITAIVTSADSGGSTGVLRDEFGTLPVGDFRQCIVALAEDGASPQNEHLLRDLFEYRFSKGGTGLSGHNFGNLFITALTDILGSEELAFRKVSKILNIKGKVYPVTFEKIQLVAEYEDGSMLIGEKMIDEPPSVHDGTMRIKKLWVQPNAEVFAKSKESIMNSDLIVFGPGDLYSSIIANIVIDDFAGIISQSKAKIVFITNMMTKYSQTYDFKVSDFIEEVEKYLRKPVDYILVNSSPIPKDIIENYTVEKAIPVENDMKDDKRVIEADLISEILYEQKNNDVVKRSVLRHSSKKIADELQRILEKS